jgi:DNA repair exonuclease SbcCD ATPase subunit
MTTQKIDYLFEDPVLRGQEFALVSIVGPHMKQKCDVWGMKVRGVADTLDTAKQMVQRLMKIDNNYDIYIVETGKFFPLNVEPMSVNNVEYQNEQLNNLMKSYLENRRAAEDSWLERKNKMVEEAIREGQNQEELANRQEHPIAVLQRIQQLREQEVELKDMLTKLTTRLQESQTKFDNYTEEERDNAQSELVSNSNENSSNKESDLKSQIEKIRQELEECNVDSQKEELQKQLNEKVNEMVNSNFTSSEYDYLTQA